ncbi:MAG: DUF3524 domain-containing protein [Spirochaetia bacterium]
MNFLFIEPFYGGSHKNFAQGLATHSRHSIDLITMDPRFWKWRMESAAFYIFKKVPDPSMYDAIIITNMICVSHLISLWTVSRPPVLLYFHENQFCYPVAKGEHRDYHYAMEDIRSASTADLVLFNSKFHLDSFFTSARSFLKRMPDYPIISEIDAIEKKSSAVYPGIWFETDVLQTCSENKPQYPVILWNHRWEYDKGPERFIRGITEAKKKGLIFKVILAGESYKKKPEVFEKAREQMKDVFIHFGYAKERIEYEKLLGTSTIVVSTANQENFGISVVEATASGCLPLLPNRLSYPELVPEKYHQLCLYNEKDFISKLCSLIEGNQRPPQDLVSVFRGFIWKNQAKEFDSILEELIK